jgi:hypothetical protein
VPPLRPLAELERGGEWQISAASATIVSGFSLQTNGYRLGFRASPGSSDGGKQVEPPIEYRYRADPVFGHNRRVSW